MQSDNEHGRIKYGGLQTEVLTSCFPSHARGVCILVPGEIWQKQILYIKRDNPILLYLDNNHILRNVLNKKNRSKSTESFIQD